MTTFTLQFSAKQLARLLFLIIIGLGLAHLLGLVLSCVTHNNAVISAVKLVNLDRERNIPTLFSTGLFLLNASLFWIVHHNSRTFKESRWAWPVLTGVFAFLGLDEFGAIHEQFSDAIRDRFHTSGVLYYGWVIPYGIGAIILATIVLPTMYQLRPKIRKWFFIAALLYLGGALGLEGMSGLVPHLDTQNALLHGLMVGCEELLEMSGLATLTYGLLIVIEKYYGGLSIVLPSQVKSDQKLNQNPSQSPTYFTLDFSRLSQGRLGKLTSDDHLVNHTHSLPTKVTPYSH